jgi:hypothetical protein
MPGSWFPEFQLDWFRPVIVSTVVPMWHALDSIIDTSSRVLSDTMTRVVC